MTSDLMLEDRPIGYAYVYPHYSGGTVLRFDTGGREINGSAPIETIPLYTRPAPSPATMAEIVAAAEAWVEAEKTCDEYCFHSVAQRAYARARFLSLVAAHEAEVAKVLEPFAKPIGYTHQPDSMKMTMGANEYDQRLKITLGDLRAAADLRRRVTAAPHEKREG